MMGCWRDDGERASEFIFISGRRSRSGESGWMMQVGRCGPKGIFFDESGAIDSYGGVAGPRRYILSNTSAAKFSLFPSFRPCNQTACWMFREKTNSRTERSEETGRI